MQVRVPGPAAQRTPDRAAPSAEVLDDRRPAAAAQAQLRDMAARSDGAQRLHGLQRAADASPQARRLTNLSHRLNGAVVQRIDQDRLKALGARMETEVAAQATSGMNLWIASHAGMGAKVYLLGTNHGLRITQIAEWRAVVKFLQTEPFTHVFSETTGAIDSTNPKSASGDVVAKLEDKLQKEQARDATTEGTRDRVIAEARLASADNASGRLDKQSDLDDAYVTIALSRENKPVRGLLDTPEKPGVDGGPKTPSLRDAAKAQNETHGTPHDQQLVPSPEATDAKDVKAGNQRVLWSEQAREAKAGLDYMSAEERNDRWMGNLVAKPGDCQLWVVGAAHLPGLVLRFRDLAGWTAEHRPPVIPELPKPEDTAEKGADTTTGSTSTHAEDVD